MFRLIITFLILCFIPTFVSAQDDLDLMDMSLEELLNMEVTVASGHGKKIAFRESPAIVTVINREEIQNNGARDIYDILRLVPGFDFGSDIMGINGIGVRGIFASEGKILFLIDEIPMNDHLYGYPFFADMFFVNQIEKIEIIRGPGSAIYGGFAEMAVVNIITTKPDDKIGARLNAAVSYMEKSLGKQSAEFYYGHSADELSISVSGGIKTSVFSDKVFTNYSGVDYELSDFNKADAWSLRGALKYKNFSLNLLGSNLNYNFPFPDIEEKLSIRTTFSSFHADARYIFPFANNGNINFRTIFSRVNSWNNTKKSYLEYDWYTNSISQRIIPSLTADFDLNDEINLTVGTEYIGESGQVSDDSPADITFNSGDREVKYYTFSGYFQSMLKYPFANIVVGARYDKHNIFEGAFVPRLAITKVWENLHIKTIASKAYRAPTIANLDFNPDIKPEYTTVFEFETGYKFNEQNHIVLNVFDIRTKDVIIYSYDTETETEHYNNFKDTGTSGFELSFNHINTSVNVNLGYSFYKVNNTSVPTYLAYRPDETIVDDLHFGFPQHKISGQISYFINKGMILNSTFNYFSKRYGASSLVDSYYKEFKPAFLLNLTYRYQNFLTEHLNLRLEAYDILKTDYQFVQAYDHGYEANWGPTREFLFGLEYDF